MRNLADRECGVQAAIALRDYHALISLQAFAITFTNPNLDNYGVARAELRNITLHLRLIQLINNLAHLPVTILCGKHVVLAANF